ncbi:MAG: hypothetical protein P0Y49_14495 [Candidatus Pedobacter colombiensis]|uniref:Uncharacterized protein n=1 Tax=Candidatus Pedobacter colombiensis TaxID=3121371 RepID=A0AAJ6B7F0_9SPHI|nr:hypothetical protein [Pedobacter sp.]WEK18003.1 MAG: hypothetical protein P0Y49_14495 [Pedobacter sp.]
MTELEIREKIDLHRSGKDSSKNYVEFYFHACFYEFFNSEDSYWKTNLDGSELSEILKTLNVQVDFEILKTKYNNQQNHDVEVFHSTSDEQVFVYFIILPKYWTAD